MKAIQLTLLLLIPAFASAQKPAPVCKCPDTMFVPAGAKPVKIFHFSNNRTVGLFGYEESKLVKGKTLYSEFVLTDCGAKKIVKFWGAVLTCDVTFANDTIYVKTLYDFPVGKAMKAVYLPWTIGRIYYSRGKTTRDLNINPAIPKYTQEQVAYVLDQYQHTPNANEEATIDLADKLLVCTMSGSKKAKYLLLTSRKSSPCSTVFTARNMTPLCAC